MPTNPQRALRIAVANQIASTVDDLSAACVYPWTGQAAEDIAALARKHGYAAWVRVRRIASVDRAPRAQDVCKLEVVILAATATQAPRSLAHGDQQATATERCEQLSQDIRNVLRDADLVAWQAGRGLEYASTSSWDESPTCCAAELIFETHADLRTFSETVGAADPLPARAQISYSVDGEAGWSTTYDADTHVWRRVSLDYGETWGTAERLGGLQGEIGPAGPAGATGAQGIQGIQGATGAAGADGGAGAQGIQGIQGDTGAAGADGGDGAQGIQGIQGDTGAAGATGAQGIQGETGAAGADGGDGAQGIQGLQGETGATGTDGADGAQGIQGIQGDKGDTGDTGAQGIQGATGAAGADGDDGTDGATWHHGSGVPSSGLGADGDYYLDYTNDQIYYKATGAWSSIWTAPTGGSGSGIILQYQAIELSSRGSFTGNFPGDDTWPQITEGTEIFTTTFTPSAADSTLIISWAGTMGSSATDGITIGIFWDQATAALVIQRDSDVLTGHHAISFTSPPIASPGTSEINMSIRVGVKSGTGYYNRAANLFMGGAIKSVMTIVEVAA